MTEINFDDLLEEWIQEVDDDGWYERDKGGWHGIDISAWGEPFKSFDSWIRERYQITLVKAVKHT